MKNLLYLLLIFPLFISCSSDDDNDGGDKQDYTSLTIVNDSKTDFPSLIISYYKDNVYYKIETVFDFNDGKSTEEIIIDNKYIDDVYLFISTYGSFGQYYKVIVPIPIKKNIHNNFIYTSTTKAVLVDDITDNSKFPQ